MNRVGFEFNLACAVNVIRKGCFSERFALRLHM